jgi:hypothetical protein
MNTIIIGKNNETDGNNNIIIGSDITSHDSYRLIVKTANCYTNEEISQREYNLLYQMFLGLQDTTKIDNLNMV